MKMRFYFFLLTSFFCTFYTTNILTAQSIGTISEMEAAQIWSQALASEKLNITTSKLIPQTTVPSFFFVYDSQKSVDLLPHWEKSIRTSQPALHQTEQIITYSDPKTSLEVQIKTTLFDDFPAVEWIMHFKNTGNSDLPILENIKPFDACLSVSGEGDGSPVLHYANGSLCRIDDFAPLERQLVRQAQIHLQPGGGRSSSEVLPFFNIDMQSAKEGFILGIGWTGEWAADFIRPEKEDALYISAGMAKTHLKLLPGEQIRTPRILLLFWQGDCIRGNNLLRRFLLAHHRPQPEGKSLALPTILSSWGGTAAAEHLKDINWIIENDLPIQLYWIDAEWFGVENTPWFKNSGNWQVRKGLFPDGLQAISKNLHQSDREFLLWFGNLLVCKDTPWHQEFKDRPGWLLELKNGNPAYQQVDLRWPFPFDDPRFKEYESRRTNIMPGDMVFNIGEPEALKFQTDFISDRIDEFGIDWYREDFNIGPWEFWQEADTPDRQGISEIRFVEGLYQMWDELLHRHPNLKIDNCASGGRRIDLETIGRSTALWRTDWPISDIHLQCHSFGLHQWVPLHMSAGAELKEGNEYQLRSAMTAGLHVKLPSVKNDQTAAIAKKMLQEYLRIQKYFYGEFYPLTEYSQATDAWLAYQMHLPESDEGVLVVLKRSWSNLTQGQFALEVLTPDATYQLTNLDTNQTRISTGRELMELGIDIQLTNKPDSTLIMYKQEI